ncbi:MAG: hypothetical protein Fur0024_2970 [Patescibacteria group bacterium]
MISFAKADETPSGLVVSPVKINFSEEFGNLRPGKNYSSNFEIQNTSDKDLNIEIFATDGETGESNENWIKILDEDKTFSLGKKENSVLQNSKIVNFNLEIPETATDGANQLFITAKASEKNSSNSGIKIDYGISLKILFNVSRQDSNHLKLENIKIKALENGDEYDVKNGRLKFSLKNLDVLNLEKNREITFIASADLKNNSNLFANPDVLLDVKNEETFFEFNPKDFTIEKIQKISNGRSEEEIQKIVKSVENEVPTKLSGPNLFEANEMEPKTTQNLIAKKISISKTGIFEKYELVFEIYENGKKVSEEKILIEENIGIQAIFIAGIVIFAILVIFLLFAIMKRMMVKN